jgi:DNA-binding MarR family transcriptional regulator
MPSRQPRATRPVSDREYKALAAFRRALREFLYFSEQAAKDAGLTPAQHQLLLAVRGADTDQAPTIGEVAEWMKLRHHSAVELVDRAAAAGLLRRIQDSEDQRRQRLKLTAEGEQKLALLSTLHREELRRFRKQVLDPLSRL